MSRGLNKLENLNGGYKMSDKYMLKGHAEIIKAVQNQENLMED